jgi:hypothetical protein
MLWGVLARVPAGVLVLRGVAAQHQAVRQAHPQVHPGISLIKTRLAAGRLRLDVVNLIKVRAPRCGLSAYPLESRADSLQQSHERLLLFGPLSIYSTVSGRGCDCLKAG